MSPTATATRTRFTPAAFSACLLEAVEADRRRDVRDRVQHTLLLRPFAEADAEPAAFEAAMAEHCQRNADLADVAREILALWRVCSDRH
jgi:hypothetical protein